MIENALQYPVGASAPILHILLKTLLIPIAPVAHIVNMLHINMITS
jgi:hypothetical protein